MRAISGWLQTDGWRYSPHQLLDKFLVATFDRRHGTDTSRFAELSALSIASENRVQGERYQPSPVHALRRVLRRLRVRFEDFSFIDVGSGKGRTLLVAGEFPFRQVIGVEFSAELHQAAQANVQRYARRRAGAVRPVHGDATAFELPTGPLVLYFFNPFGPGVLEKVLANVARSLQEAPRPVFIVYLYLHYPDVLMAQPGMRLRERWQNFHIFEWTLPRATAAHTRRVAAAAA